MVTIFADFQLPTCYIDGRSWSSGKIQTAQPTYD